MKILKKIIFITIAILLVIKLLLLSVPQLFPNFVTSYSYGFNKNTFEKIKIGDKKTTIDSLLGKPLYISEDNNNDSVKTVYWYSKNSFRFVEYENVFIKFYNEKVIYKNKNLDID